MFELPAMLHKEARKKSRKEGWIQTGLERPGPGSGVVTQDPAAVPVVLVVRTEKIKFLR